MKKLGKNVLLFGFITAISLLVAGCGVKQDDTTSTPPTDNGTLVEQEQTSMDANTTIATVNGEAITMAEVSSIQQLFAQQWQQISTDETLEQIINQKLLEQQVTPLSIQETETILIEQLSTQNMTLDSYKEQLAMQGASYEEELENARGWFAIQAHLESELGTDFEVSDEEINAFYNEYAQSSPDALPALEDVEADIVTVLQQQKQQEAIQNYLVSLRADADIQYNQ